MWSSMKKMPLAVIAVLILIVVISGMANSEERPNGHTDNHRPPAEIDSSPTGFLMVTHMVPFLSVMDEEYFLEDNIEKSESMILRLEKAILKLENEGNDVSKLRSMLKITRILCLNPESIWIWQIPLLLIMRGRNTWNCPE